MRRPRFIVLEGLDGAGTTTQAAALAEELRARGYALHMTREPSDGPVGRLIRELLAKRERVPPESMALLFAADRLDHLEREVVPALERGAVVLSDRYVLSSMAYQGVELPMRRVAELNERAVPAGLTLFLSVKPSVAAARRARRGGQGELYEIDAFQEKVARLYRAAVRRYGKREHVVRVDGNVSSAEVTAQSMKVVARFLGQEPHQRARRVRSVRA